MLLNNNYTAMGLNSQFAIMQNNQSLLNMACNPVPVNPTALQQQEKRITFSSITNYILGRAAEVAEQSQEKQKKYDIEHSFNTFG